MYHRSPFRYVSLAIARMSRNVGRRMNCDRNTSVILSICIEVRSRRTVTRLKFENYYLCLRLGNRRACVQTGKPWRARISEGWNNYLLFWLKIFQFSKKLSRKQSVFVVESCQLSFHDDSSDSSEIQPSLKIVTTTRQQPQQNQFRVFLTNPSEWKSPASRGLIKTSMN